MRTNAMRSDDNVYYLRDRSPHAIAVTRMQEQRRHEILKAGFYVTGGAIIGFALANLPALSGALLTALNILPSHLN
jgi:hypothetical protein